MNIVTIGVDPGFRGGLTYMRGTIEANLVAVYPMPMVGKEIDLDQIKEWTKRWILMWGGDWHAWIEDAQAMRRPQRGATACPACGSLPGTQGVVATGTFMRGAGLVEGCLRGIGIECTRIKAQTWHKSMLGPTRPRGRAAVKAASIVRARELFPGVDFKRTARCTTYSDGMTDSALIAAHGSKMNVV